MNFRTAPEQNTPEIPKPEFSNEELEAIKIYLDLHEGVIVKFYTDNRFLCYTKPTDEAFLRTHAFSAWCKIKNYFRNIKGNKDV